MRMGFPHAGAERPLDYITELAFIGASGAPPVPGRHMLSLVYMQALGAPYGYCIMRL